MTPEEARRQGRTEQSAVNQYLEAISHLRPRRGPKRGEEHIRKDMAKTQAIVDSDDTSPVDKLVARQRMKTLESELFEFINRPRMKKWEEGFIEHAYNFGRRKGIQYRTWRDMGVQPATLKAAGITPRYLDHPLGRGPKRAQSSTSPSSSNGSTSTG